MEYKNVHVFIFFSLCFYFFYINTESVSRILIGYKNASQIDRGTVPWYPLYSSHSLVCQINLPHLMFSCVQYISSYVPYFAYFMLIQINVCFVYLGYKLASQIDYAKALSLSTLCIQTTFYTVLWYVSTGSITVLLLSNYIIRFCTVPWHNFSFTTVKCFFYIISIIHV